MVELEGMRERRLGMRMNELRLKEFDKLTPQEKAVVIKATKPHIYGGMRIGQLRVMMEEGKFDSELQRIRANWKR